MVYDWNGKKGESKHSGKSETERVCAVAARNEFCFFFFESITDVKATDWIWYSWVIDKHSFISEVACYARMWIRMWISLWWHLMTVSGVWSVVKSKPKGLSKFLDSKVCIDLDTWWKKKGLKKRWNDWGVNTDVFQFSSDSWACKHSARAALELTGWWARPVLVIPQSCTSSDIAWGMPKGKRSCIMLHPAARMSQAGTALQGVRPRKK